MAKAPIVLSQSSIYQMKIVLDGIKPPIWRRFLVAGDTKLSKLHRVLQIVMGWENAHLYEFKVGRVSFGDPSLDYLGKMLDAKKVELRRVAQDEKDRLNSIDQSQAKGISTKKLTEDQAKRLADAIALRRGQLQATLQTKAA